LVNTKNIWIPPGKWVEVSSSLVYDGSSDFILNKPWDLNEVPIYVKAGSILTRRWLDDVIGSARSPYDNLLLEIFPGSNENTEVLYEDDG